MLGYRDVFAEVDVLNGVQQGGTDIKRLLEGFAATDKPHAAAAFVDDSRAHGLLQVVFA